MALGLSCENAPHNTANKSTSELTMITIYVFAWISDLDLSLPKKSKERCLSTAFEVSFLFLLLLSLISCLIHSFINSKPSSLFYSYNNNYSLISVTDSLGARQISTKETSPKSFSQPKRRRRRRRKKKKKGQRHTMP